MHNMDTEQDSITYRNQGDIVAIAIGEKCAYCQPNTDKDQDRLLRRKQWTV